MQNHNSDTIKTSDTVLRKIYLSLYLKRLCVRGSWGPNRTATYWTPTLLAITVFLSRPPGLLNRGPGAQPLWDMFLNPASFLQLVWSPTADFLSSPGLYTDLTLTLLPASVTIALIQTVHGQGYNILIFLDRMHLLFTQGHFLFSQPGRVGGRYTTIKPKQPTNETNWNKTLNNKMVRLQ